MQKEQFGILLTTLRKKNGISQKDIGEISESRTAERRDRGNGRRAPEEKEQPYSKNCCPGGNTGDRRRTAVGIYDKA